MNTKTKGETQTLMQFKTSAVAGAFALALLVPAAAWAGGIVANCTETELRAAMAGGGLVTFACDGTITLASTITNAADTVLDATGHQITISGGNAVRVFYVSTNVTLTLVNLTIAEGSSTEGAGVFNNGEVSLQNCWFASNNAVGAAGIDGIWPATPTPGTNAGGGAIYNRGTMRATSCTFRESTASGGRGGTGRPGSLFPGPGGGSGCEGGSAYGGAIFNSGLTVVEACALIRNQVIGGSGGAGGAGGAGHFRGNSRRLRWHWRRRVRRRTIQ